MGLDPPASRRRCRARGGRGSRGVTIEELLHTYTEDGLLLEGVRYPAGSDLAIVYTHGVTSTVFRQTHVRVGRELQRAGYTVVAGNNRGTALATPLLQRSGARVLGGSWFDRFEDAPKDIGAWVAVAVAGGAKRIVDRRADRGRRPPVHRPRGAGGRDHRRLDRVDRYRSTIRRTPCGDQER